MLLVGVVAAAALALIIDAILAATERAVSRRPRGSVAAPAAVFAALVVAILVVLPRLPATTPAATAAEPTAGAPIERAPVARVRIGPRRSPSSTSWWRFCVRG